MAEKPQDRVPTWPTTFLLPFPHVVHRHRTRRRVYCPYYYYIKDLRVALKRIMGERRRRRFIFIFRRFTLLPINVHVVFDIIPKRLTLLQWPQTYETRRLWKTAVVYIVCEYDIEIERCVCRLAILVRHFFSVDRVLCAPQLHCMTKIGAYNNELIIIYEHNYTKNNYYYISLNGY